MQASCENPLHRAWREIIGDNPSLIRAEVMAKILVFNSNFTPCGIGAELFQECVDEILSDPDTYSEELQIWAGYQFAEECHPLPEPLLDNEVVQLSFAYSMDELS